MRAQRGARGGVGRIRKWKLTLTDAHRADKNALQGNNDPCRLCKCCCGRPTGPRCLSCIVLKSTRCIHTRIYIYARSRVHNKLAQPNIPSDLRPTFYAAFLSLSLSAIDSPYYLSFNKRRIYVVYDPFFFFFSFLVKYSSEQCLKYICKNCD